ncbi:MAG TPA: hypothetical protein VFD75_15200 [Pyrinomonadaceae bacterium]|nr:hypothetical protein [Pyrinomonadaceae bacterium]
MRAVLELSLLKTSSAFELFDLRPNAISLLRRRAAMQAEIIALRHQLTVLQRNQKPRRPALNRGDRCLWVWLSRVWSGWRSAVLIVKPETVIGWHRQGFRWYWTWKIRHGRSGRPCVPKETRHLIRTMSRENPLYVDLSFMLTRIDMPLM